MKGIGIILLGLTLLLGCNRQSNEPRGQRIDDTQTEKKPVTEKEQIESEIRPGGLKDPGGAKALRDESNQQHQEQQQQQDQADQ